MDYAHYEIGTKYDENGEPLFLADGKIVGTVAEVKALIDQFERARLAASVPLYDPRRPATIGDIHAALDAFHVRNRRALMAGAIR